ncbi:MAG: hypothetical protein R3D52_15365 [Xanthobacteraceae bacterium]
MLSIRPDQHHSDRLLDDGARTVMCGSRTQSTLAFLLQAVFAFGWAFLLASTFAINHFDLFGLRQVFLNFKQQPDPPVPFVKRAMCGTFAIRSRQAC